MTDRRGGTRRILMWAAALAVSLAGAALFHLQARAGFVPSDHALDLTRPDDFLLPRSAPVGPSKVGYLRWEARAPLRVRVPGLAAPSRLRLKLLPECPGTAIEVRIDERPVRRLDLAPEWTLYTVVIAPGVAGEALALAPVGGSAGCAVHLSAIHTTTLERQSSDYPRYWVVHAGPGAPPPPVGGPWPWAVAGLLLVTVAIAGRRGSPGLASWLRLVVPGVVLLAVVEGATRASDLRFVYPPASFPALLLLPGLLLLGVHHRRALWRRARPVLRRADLALRARPALVLGVAALVGWSWVLANVSETRFGGDARGLVSFGTQFGTADAFSGVPTVGSSGYDGQFYAVLATDPLHLRPETLDRLDNPTYRATRILVPLLAWLLALGRPDAALWTYMALCWLLTLGIVPVLGAWLRNEGSSPWWAALLLVNAGIAAAVLRVTLDGAALFFLLLAFAAYRRERPLPATVAAVAAALTREVFVLGALAMALIEARNRRWRRAALYALVPAGTLALWRLRVAAAATAVHNPSKAASVVLGWPFGWLPEQIERLRALGQVAPAHFRSEVVGLVALALALAVAFGLLRHAGRDPAALTLVGFAVIGLLLSGAVYEEIYASARVLIALPVLGLGLSASPQLGVETRRWLRLVVVAWAVAGLLMLAAAL